MKLALFVAVAAMGVYYPATASEEAVAREGCVVPPLACFGSAPVRRFTLPAVISDLSSLAFNPDTDTLFAVNNGAAMVFELELWTGELINSWNLPGIMDPEGITWLGGDMFGITDENPSSIFTVKLDPAVDSGEIVTTVMQGIDPPAGENQGFEGVTWVPGTGFLAAQEMRPTAVWSVASEGEAPRNLYGDRFLGSELGFLSLGDMTRSCDRKDEYFLLVKEPTSVHRIDLATGMSLEQYAGQVCGLAQPEGLVFAQPDEGPLLMIVVGEPYHIMIFEAEEGCTKEIGSTKGKLKECPIRDYSGDVGCEKTMEEGGCPYSRCNKVKTNHIKICTDTEPGVTDCSREECHQKCVDETSFECTHYSYDVAERECYVFEGCIDQMFDEDYVQYALVDPTCERTLDDYPLGCPARRCSKSLNENEKVCDKDTETCTLEECKAMCEEYAPFQCSTYAYDTAEAECYVFETCLGEGEELDYNLYVLVDPTCEKNLADGGCDNRVCSQDPEKNTFTLVCSGTSSDSELEGCSVEECRLKCANTKELECAYFSYDPIDEDCILFAECHGETFHDDFNTYVLPYDEKIGTKECTKGLNEGGCETSRCDKKITEHVKICTDEEPGVTDCSLEECQQKCLTHDDFTCSHFAWDERERECYIFEGCNGVNFDADYTQYAMKCDAGLNDGGCPTLRCDKTKTDNVKICTKDEPGVTDCSLEQCHQHCKDSTELTCTHFAWDEAEQECYIFEGCNGEKYDADYTQFAMKCDSDLLDGGCPTLRCDKKLTNNLKICTADEPGVTDCSLDECAQYCKESGDLSCTHFAYDEAESECYIFEGCTGEKFDADYTQYVLPGCTPCDSSRRRRLLFGGVECC